MTQKNKLLTLSSFNSQYLKHIWRDGFQDENPEWTKWNAPYFNDYHAYPSFSQFEHSPITDYLLSDSCKCICLDEKGIGMVSKNWIDEVTRWLEIGIVIYNPTYWHGGIGGRVLKIWISEIFDQYPELEHIGLTTWSGNPRMIHLAQKLGFKKEAQIRKVRFYKEKYYDCMKYGILRDEWINKKR